ncbi:UNVERIFIED_CONTAM: hypothetical protein FKN15_051315 [Acipenser sinensis]
MNVLSLCGPESGLPKNPSVVFSSNEDLDAGDQQTSLISTTEEAIQEEGTAVEDTSSEQQFGVFKDFDFLDVELEDAEGESMDNFNWGVRRRSLDSIDKGDTPSLQECQYSGSTPSLNLTNQEDTDESSEEEVLTASQILSRTQILNSDSATDDAASNHVDSLLQSQESSSSAVTEEAEAPQAESPNLEPAVPDSTNSQLPEDASAASVEEEVSIVSEDTESYSAPPVPQESQDPPDTQESQDSSEPPAPDSPPGSICEEDVTLALKELDESFLGERLQRIGSKFRSSLEVMMTSSECPTVFVDAETLVSCGLLETLKFSVLELQEHLDTYNVKREAAEQWLSNCKITFGGKDGTHRPNTEAQELELCRRLYKLHFQLLLLFQAYCKLISRVDAVKREAEVINMSEELAQLESSLKEAEATADKMDEEIAIPEAAQASSETAIHSLIETLRNKEFVAALAQVKTFRAMWPNDIFGNTNDDAVQTLLHIYFRHQTLGQTGSFAIVCSNQDLSEASSKLMELNMEIRESLRMMQSYQPLAQAKLLNTSSVSTGF